MADTLTQEVQDAIARNLPAQVAGALQQHLGAAQVKAAELESAKGRIVAFETSARAAAEAQSKQATKITELESKLREFEKREAEFTAAERSVLDANYQAQIARSAHSAAMEVIGQVFRNATVKRSVIENGMAPAGVAQNNGYGAAMSTATTNSKTETEEVVG